LSAAKVALSGDGTLLNPGRRFAPPRSAGFFLRGTISGMDKKLAIAASQQLAERMSVTLGPCRYYRVFGDDPNTANHAVLFSAPSAPRGWEWLAIVNDDAEDGVLVAIKRKR
jgi:hypothetical protein